MFALRNAITRVGQTTSMAVMPKRTAIVSGPPEVKISGIEKAAHGVLIAIGMTFIPAWILVHIKDYRGSDDSS